MNSYASSRNESCLREKQQEPCEGSYSVRNQQRRGWGITPGVIDERRSEAREAQENHDNPRANVKPPPPNPTPEFRELGGLNNC